MRLPPGHPPNSCTAWADAIIYDQLEPAKGRPAKRVVVRRPPLVPVYTSTGVLRVKMAAHWRCVEYEQLVSQMMYVLSGYNRTEMY